MGVGLLWGAAAAQLHSVAGWAQKVAIGGERSTTPGDAARTVIVTEQGVSVGSTGVTEAQHQAAVGCNIANDPGLASRLEVEVVEGEGPVFGIGAAGRCLGVEMGISDCPLAVHAGEQDGRQWDVS